MELPFAESWRIKMVEPIRKSTREEREAWLKAAHYNVFQLLAECLLCDDELPHTFFFAFSHWPLFFFAIFAITNTT